MAIKWLSRDQRPERLSPASQEALRAMREVYDVCPEEEKSLVRDAFNEYCEGATQEIGPRGSQRPDDLRAEDEADLIRQIRRIAQDHAIKTRARLGAVRVPPIEERIPGIEKVTVQW